MLISKAESEKQLGYPVRITARQIQTLFNEVLDPRLDALFKCL